MEGPPGPLSNADGERSPRPRARSGIGEGLPRGSGTSPRSGDGPEGDEGTRARPRRSRKEIGGDGRGEGQARASKGGEPRAGTRRSTQAAPGSRPRSTNFASGQAERASWGSGNRSSNRR